MPVAGRLDLHVVARFLDKMASGERFSRSHLQRAVRLNYDLFCKYLETLEARGLVVREDTDCRITEEGSRIHRELLRWLEDLFGGRP